MDKRLGNTSSISVTTSSTEDNHEIAKDLDFKHDNFVVIFDSATILEHVRDQFYHQNDLLPIIRTIADKFSSVCFLQQNSVEAEAVAIYNRMTMQNKNKSNFTNSSQPLRLYQMFNAHSLDYAINSVKSANSLYPDTVKYLLFNQLDAKKLFSYVTNAEENMFNQTVGFAIKLPLLDCLRGTSVRNQVSRLLSYIKLIVITIGTEQDDYDVGVDKTVFGFTKPFARCKKKIESMSQEQSPKFAFSLTWHDTDSHSIQNLSNLVSFWGQMNNWAKITNTTVFMAEAFDGVTKKHNDTNGWWRLAFNPHIYHSIAEYVYKDKTERQSMIRNGSRYSANNTSLNKDVAFQKNWKVINSSFSRTNFIVQFGIIISNRYITDADNFNEDQIGKIILKLFTRFSSICTETLYTTDLLHNSMRHVPMAVAKFNRERGLKNVTHSLYMIFTVDKEQDAFQVALEKAMMANSVSAGSVKYLIGYIDNDYLGDGRTKLNYFIKAKQFLSKASSTVSYKLASVFSIGYCGHGKNPNKQLIPLMKVLDLVIFHYAPRDMDYEVGVYESFQGMTKLFERCKEKISQLNLSIEVAFRTSWSDTNKYHGQGYEKLVLFWEKMNEWAELTNTKIFMLEAFDSQNTETVEESKLGWWRFVSEEIQNGSTEFIFEEKREIVLAKDNLVHGSSRPRTVLISVLTVLVVFVLAAFSVFLFVYRKYTTKLAKARQHILTLKEETEFFEGGSVLQTPREELALDAHLQKYNKDFEVKQDDFKLDETALLGSGEFGIVCKGTVTKDDKEIDVAVKKLKKITSETVKNLLTEIKVMIHLGKHENIVSIIGAHTEGIRQGNVLVFIELCEKGSLENYLRELRRQFVTSASATTEDKAEVNGHNSQQQNDELKKNAFDQNVLVKWSYEIANGMEFIVSKKVVHADLATRNVLLTENLTAKISDFGLSRRLDNYNTYVKTQQQAIPWKWMSPESLRRWEFNEKTDVWAFGITLWEIYSLGDAPYPGLPFSVNFSLKLEKGLRPQEPEFNANSIYSIMLRCWNIDPKNRPTFLQLKEILKRL